MADVVLHGTANSPFVMRVQMALKLKGVDYEYVQEDLGNKSDRLLEVNPIYKKVPVLVHNGNPIPESSIIVEYIDEVFPGPSILPEDPYERSTARFWIKYLDDKSILPLWKSVTTMGEEKEKAKEEGIQSLQILENQIKGKKFFGGDKIGIVDISASFIAHWYRILEELTGVNLLTQDKFPNLCKWADEFCNDAFIKENLPPREIAFARFKTILETTGFRY